MSERYKVTVTPKPFDIIIYDEGGNGSQSAVIEAAQEAMLKPVNEILKGASYDYTREYDY